jgi:predicted helicase
VPTPIRPEIFAYPPANRCGMSGGSPIIRECGGVHRFVQWFLTNDPVYKHELRRVWLWNEWPGRWGIDAGIDLVAEDRQGHLWAIQAKAYSPAYPGYQVATRFTIMVRR